MTIKMHSSVVVFGLLLASLGIVHTCREIQRYREFSAFRRDCIDHGGILTETLPNSWYCTRPRSLRR